jgi:hypothetical protein
MSIEWFTVNHYYAGTDNIPPSFQSFEVVKREEAEDAIAERDGKIRELEAMVERLRNCWNCKNSDVRCSYFDGPVCERWEEEKR